MSALPQMARTAQQRLLQGLLLLLCLIGLLAVNAAQAEIGKTTVFLHEDALGSPIAATDEAGALVWQGSYSPYGEPLEESPQSLSYTGHVYDADSGLVYMGARYYDPQIGRFLSRDPVSFRPSEALSFNPYVYANNNPYRYVDPDGRESKTQAEQLADMGFGPGLSANATSAAKNVGEGFSKAADEISDLAFEYYAGVATAGAATLGVAYRYRDRLKRVFGFAKNAGTAWTQESSATLLRNVRCRSSDLT